MEKFPAIFLSHGSPMMALETEATDPYVKTLRELGKKLPKPKALVFVSAHWYVRGKFVDVADMPQTIYDFYGFPNALYGVKYPAPGYPEVASELDGIFGKGTWKPVTRGLDHGVWTTLVHLYPKADVPVITISLDATDTERGHFETGKKLSVLRERGYLVVGSGNIVHDLGSVDFSRGPGTAPHAFGAQFDEAFRTAVENRDFETLFEPQKMPGGIRSVPSPDHYLPALVILGTATPDDRIGWLFEGFELASIGRRAFFVDNSSFSS